MQVAYLFSGQGAERAGMGAEFYQHNLQFKQAFDQASQILELDLPQLCFTADSRLQTTEYAQPALVALNWALYQASQAQLPPANALLGLSLGEYGALLAGGQLTLNDGLMLVKARGHLMAQACQQQAGEMVVVLKASAAQIEAACVAGQQQGAVMVANYNSPQQVVLGGTTAGIAAAVAYLRAQGVKRILPLPVSGAFHTPLMQSAATAFTPYLAQCCFSAGELPVWSNTTCTPFTAATLATTLAQQMVQPTHFAACIKALVQQGVDTFVEFGPAPVLARLVKQTAPHAQVYQVADPESLTNTVIELEVAHGITR
ncbi:ACP S-malonyltransferase [Loigolactobacillus jiayinensis]|uniref:Malonyl CoA-acyl carrier protein transacylase n=1 Tax=Loigolactobacillus jiayinensis TaxID=2486016 RepID=A0ABW1R837_9LACO|nr:ACP S-malonyltransferase [Loigolactobacillus jiayinensis]